MGMFDNLKGKADQLKEKASALVDQHGDKIDQGLDKAGEMVDKKTGGKYTDQIATGKTMAREQLDNLDGRKDDFPRRDDAVDEQPAPIDPATPIPPAEPIDPTRAAQPALSRRRSGAAPLAAQRDTAPEHRGPPPLRGCGPRARRGRDAWCAGAVSCAR